MSEDRSTTAPASEADDAEQDTSALQQAGEVLKREGRQVADEARSVAQQFASDQRDALADYVAALADAASRGAEDLEGAGYGRSASTVSRTADEVGDFAKRLQAREPGELWENVEGFARDHPALVFGAGFAVAFGVTRFLKSSAEPEDDPGSAADPAEATATAMSGE